MAAYKCHQNDRVNHHTSTVSKYFQNKICVFAKNDAKYDIIHIVRGNNM